MQTKTVDTNTIEGLRECVALRGEKWNILAVDRYIIVFGKYVGLDD